MMRRRSLRKEERNIFSSVPEILERGCQPRTNRRESALQG